MKKSKKENIENQLETVKALNELKKVLGSFCKLMVNSFDLELCLIQFNEPNPIISPVVVSYPSSEYENLPENEIEDIELKLISPKKSLSMIPILHDAKSIGALLMRHEMNAIPSGEILDELKNSAGKIANTIKKIAGIEVKNRIREFVRKYISYKKKTGISLLKDEHIIFKLLSSIIVPTRLYIEIINDDGSHIFHHVTTGPEGIRECFYGQYGDNQFANLIKMIKNDKNWSIKVDIKECGQEKGKIFLQFEKSGSFVDDEIEKCLMSIGSQLAELVSINFIAINFQGEL